MKLQEIILTLTGCWWLCVVCSTRPDVIDVKYTKKSQVKCQNKINRKGQDQPVLLVDETFDTEIYRRWDNADKVDEKGEFRSKLVTSFSMISIYFSSKISFLYSKNRAFCRILIVSWVLIWQWNCRNQGYCQYFSQG